MKNKILLLIILFNISCSHYRSVNSIQQEKMQLRSEKESLPLLRTSWFHEITMTYDMYVGVLEQSSSFFKRWISPANQEKASTCSSFYIGFLYQEDFSKIDHLYILNQLSKQGISSFKLEHFSDYLSLHRAYPLWSLKDYKVYGLCKQNLLTSSGKLSVELPNYKKVSVQP